jgi:hypothetical protein
MQASGVGGDPATRSYTIRTQAAAPVTVTAAAAVAGGVRLTALGHGLIATDPVYASGIGSVADGFYAVTSVVDANNVVINAALAGTPFTADGIVEKVGTATGTVPYSPRLAAAPYGIQGDEYVWHCHILEHEEHDMMHPLIGS